MLDGGVLARLQAWRAAGQRRARLAAERRVDLAGDDHIDGSADSLATCGPWSRCRASSPLWRTDGVIVSPHVAAKPTPQTVRRVFERNLTTFVQSGIDALPHKLGEHY
jgi:hypothetical protein